MVLWNTIAAQCELKEDRSIVTKATTGKPYCVFNSGVEKLMDGGLGKINNYI